jgi:histidine triad (HIT) family protein
MTQADCLFCRIVSGEVPSDRVAETEISLAFRDINPVAPQHVLVVPKRHVADSLADLDDPVILADMTQLVREIARGDELAGGWRLVTNIGADGGQTVPHLHLHLLGGRKMKWPPG